MKKVEVICAGCGKMFEHREAPDNAPNRIHGTCDECNTTFFKSGNKAKAAVAEAASAAKAEAVPEDSAAKA